MSFNITVLLVAVSYLTLTTLGSKIYSPTECARECVSGEPSRICYYNFTLEQYSVLGLACNVCTPTPLNTFLGNCECVTADGVERMLLTVNRMLPGPSIQVCQHDKVVIDVKNDIPGMGVTIHWHGIKQKGTPYYDGVPMVTQCPIAESTTFRYQWIAEDFGTHFWHSHAGLQRMDGIYGSLVVRQPKYVDIHGHLYDYDLTTHVILISDWYHKFSADWFPGAVVNDPGQIARNLLINGKGIYIDPKLKNETKTPVETFEVQPGKRYRFRIINSMSSVCTSILSVQGHKLTLIATDGDPVVPVEVDSINSASGERYDFVLKANQKLKSYWIQIRGLEECDESQAQQFAILKYTGSKVSSLSQRPSYENPLYNGTVANNYDGICHGAKKNGICVSELSSAKEVDWQMWDKPDLQIYMPFEIFQYQTQELFKPKEPKDLYLVAPDSLPYGSIMGNITYISAPSPLLSQYNDIDPKKLCYPNNKPPRCIGTKCSCTELFDVPLNAMVELVLVDAMGQPLLYHPFHLHGHSFNVMAVGTASDLNTDKITYKGFQEADQAGLIVRKHESPPFKDTIMVPQNGYVVVRFRADNPGFWFLHCHFELHTVIGMGLVFEIGKQSDVPPVPRGFPRCGDFGTPILPDVTTVE